MCNRDLAAELFDLGCTLNRVNSMSLAPDATAGIDRYMDECARRSDILDAARESDIADLADEYMTTANKDTARELVDWLIEELIAEDPVDVINAIAAAGGWLNGRMEEAARKMATNDWDTRYGKP